MLCEKDGRGEIEMGRCIRSLCYLLVLSVVLMGCTISIGGEESGGSINGTEEYSYNHDKLAENETVRLKLEFGAGELTLSGTDSSFIDSNYKFSHKNLKPEIKMSGSNPLKLDIKHSGRVSTNLKGFVNQWDIKLQEELAYHMEFDLGVGLTNLDLAQFNQIEELKIKTGVGESKITLSHNPTQSYKVDVEAGIGQTTIYYPEHVGVKVKTKQGLGSTSLRDLHFSSEHDAHVNDAYGQSEISIEITVEQGIGEVSLQPLK